MILLLGFLLLFHAATGAEKMYRDLFRQGGKKFCEAVQCSPGNRSLFSVLNTNLRAQPRFYIFISSLGQSHWKTMVIIICV